MKVFRGLNFFSNIHKHSRTFLLEALYKSDFLPSSPFVGISIKICIYDESDRMAVRTEDKTLYTEDDFRDFLTHRGLIGLREINGYTCFDNLDDLRSGVMYQGVRLLGE